MKFISKHYKKMKIAYIKTAGFAAVVTAFFLPHYQKLESTGDNLFIVSLNGEEVGVMGDLEEVDSCLIAARREIAGDSDEMVLADSELTYEGQEVLWGEIDDDSVIIENMAAVLRNSERETLNRSYTVKINEYTVNLSSAEEVLALLQASLGKYDTEKEYYVDLVMDPDRELTVLTTAICAKEEAVEEEREMIVSAGIDAELDDIFASVEPEVEKDFSDYELGLQTIGFGDTVEVVEAYLQDYEITSLQDAIEEVTKDQEKEQIYEVVSGDTLSQIAERNELTLDELIAMNDTIDDASSTIRVGDELIITVPEPELSVERTEEVYYEEDYEAVPKIVERGTKIPPTYIKPISGGRQSSGFGRRNAPTRGASTYHKGIDWATPTGTAVMASSAGTVVKAGWGSGYGYVVYINHADGRQTRYGHLSKVLVTTGQTVSQGQKIALSGNTGVSTGPHVHFEILINGSQVNPLNYLN